MRCLRKNMKPFWYAQYVGKTPRKDENGYMTGEYDITYSNPVRMRGNVTAGSGSIHTQMWGTNWSFDRVIILSDPNTPINDDSVLWIDKTPEDGTYDYKVKRISRGLNGVTIGVTKVTTA